MSSHIWSLCSSVANTNCFRVNVIDFGPRQQKAYWMPYHGCYIIATVVDGHKATKMLTRMVDNWDNWWLYLGDPHWLKNIMNTICHVSVYLMKSSMLFLVPACACTWVTWQIPFSSKIYPLISSECDGSNMTTPQNGMFVRSIVNWMHFVWLMIPMNGPIECTAYLLTWYISWSLGGRLTV